MMNVTGVNADEEGFVTVWPCGEPQPGTSSLNLTPGAITPNLVISKVGANGKVCLFTQRSADLIADLTGTATAAAPTFPSPARGSGTLGWTRPLPNARRSRVTGSPSTSRFHTAPTPSH